MVTDHQIVYSTWCRNQDVGNSYFDSEVTLEDALQPLFVERPFPVF